jgi:hypothetical protein
MVTMMQRQPVTFEVDAELAQALAALPEEKRRKIELLINLRLRDLLTTPPRPLTEAMNEMSRHAAANGLTPEELESILNEPHAPGGH